MCLRLCLVLVLAFASCARATDPDSDSGVLDCLSADSPADCLLRSQEAPGADQGAVAIPASVNSMIERIGDAIATGIGRWIPEQADDGVQDVDQARGKKKKVKKAIKKAILKLIIVGLLIKQKIKMVLMAAQTLLQFKFLLLASIYVLSNIVKIWLDIKAHKQPHKVIYYENAHHQHHYEPEHHDFEDHEHGGGGGWGGLWGRSIVATEPPTTSAQAQDAAYPYSAYRPTAQRLSDNQ